MSKKKGQNKSFPSDVTLAYFANAKKPVATPKKVTVKHEVINSTDISWDEIPDDVDIRIGNKANPDGTTNFVVTKNTKLNNTVTTSEGEFIAYPEIVWYQISRYIAPEDIARFALISKTTWAITHQKSFWLHIYKKYCKHKPLPKRLKIEDEPVVYGLKTKVILALYSCHKYFIKKLKEEALTYNKPQELINRRCVGFDIYEGSGQCKLFFKLKKKQEERRVESNFMKELDKLDANPEEHVKLLMVNLKSKCELKELQPFIGMTLTSVKISLSRCLASYKMVLGFNSGTYIDKGILPETTFFLDQIKNIQMHDWWHPEYPHFKIGITYDARMREEDEHEPVLEKDFFSTDQKVTKQ